MKKTETKNNNPQPVSTPVITESQGNSPLITSTTSEDIDLKTSPSPDTTSINEVNNLQLIDNKEDEVEVPKKWIDKVHVKNDKESDNRELIIDEGFKSLLRPLSSEEFFALESLILKDGCLYPILIWNKLIIDGHNRYSICIKHNLPFVTKELEFKDRDEAVSWILQHQAARRNVNSITVTYIIGKEYNSLKKNRTNNLKQFSKGNDYPSDNKGLTTSEQLAQNYDLSDKSIKNYGRFAEAINKISEIMGNDIKKDILNGKYKLKAPKLIKLSKLSKTEIEDFFNNKTSKSSHILSPKALSDDDRIKILINKLVSILIPSLKDITPPTCPKCKSKSEIIFEISFDPEGIKTNPNDYVQDFNYYCIECGRFIGEVKDSTGQKSFQ